MTMTKAEATELIQAMIQDIRLVPLEGDTDAYLQRMRLVITELYAESLCVADQDIFAD